ncbi:Ldh family oxidoreductase [Pectobacterium aroidearum]|uniref:Ldh family oxidoreductase n=1 Tax=Pectobacterium aroidearum TaxID=1201031 RepID=UPI002634203F|nr:Ldh family oxidoreductase [Pectobacterium aroidearum]WKA62480.1 Ldh family oxidoreductase [Pectobacterium aroidearum]
MSITISSEKLRWLVTGLFELNGCAADIAQDIAEHMIEAEQNGYASHGVALLPKYLDSIAKGEVKPNARADITASTHGLLQINGQGGFGQHIAKTATKAAINKAKQDGYCILTLSHCHHLGRLGHYGQLAADNELCMLSFSNVTGRSPTVAPWGGAEARLTTNPFCFTWPVPGGKPAVLVDFATSSMALNKARILAEQGEYVAAGQLIDASGCPTNDPGVLFTTPAGALLPFGQHKGFGLALMIELMAGILSGGETIAEDQAESGSPHNNFFALLLSPEHFCDQSSQKCAYFMEYLLATQPQSGNSEVVYPGMPEAASRQRNQSLTLSSSFWQWLTMTYTAKGISLDVRHQTADLIC